MNDSEYLVDNIEATIQRFVQIIRNHVSDELFKTVIEPESLCLANRCDVLILLIDTFEDLFIKEKENFTQLSKVNYEARQAINRHIELNSELEDEKFVLNQEVSELQFKLKHVASAECLQAKLTALEGENRELHKEIILLTSEVKSLKIDYMSTQAILDGFVNSLNNLVSNYKKSSKRYAAIESEYIIGRIEKNLELWERIKTSYKNGHRFSESIENIEQKYKINRDFFAKLLNEITSKQSKVETVIIGNEQSDLLSTQQNESIINMSTDDKMDFNVQMNMIKALKSIPCFDGNDATTRPEQVDEFIAHMKMGASMLEKEQIKQFISILIATKLKHRAYRTFKLQNIGTISKFVEEFEKQFRPQETLDAINEKFRACEQMHGESVEQYGERIQQLVYTYEQIARNKFAMTEFIHVDHLALTTFLKGLQDDKVREQVSLGNPELLEEAIRKAITATNIFNLIKRCDLCNGKGHLVSDCKMFSMSLNRSSCQLCGGMGHSANNCGQLKDLVTGHEIVCAICKQTGHVAINCGVQTTLGPKLSDTNVMCQLCTKKGHTVHNCPDISAIMGGSGNGIALVAGEQNGRNYGQSTNVKTGANIDVICYKCNQQGHMSHACQTYAHVNSNMKNAIVCQICNRAGHVASTCRQNTSNFGNKVSLCQICNRTGHTANNCRQNAGAGSMRGNLVCQLCNRVGHSASNCRSGNALANNTHDNGPVCYKCHQQGHFARECRANNNNTHDNGPLCYTCHQHGHFARECRSNNNNRLHQNQDHQEQNNGQWQQHANNGNRQGGNVNYFRTQFQSNGPRVDNFHQTQQISTVEVEKSNSGN